MKFAQLVEGHLIEKILSSHVNEAFNEEMQAKFMYETINGQKYELLNKIDKGTRYRERKIKIPFCRTNEAHVRNYVVLQTWSTPKF